MKGVQRIVRLILLALLLALVIHEAAFLFLKTSFYATFLAKNHFQYTSIRDSFKFSGSGVLAKSMLDMDATVQITPPGWHYAAVVLKYQLYPIKTKEAGTHVIDLNNSLKDPPAHWQKRNLFKDIRLFAKPGFGFLKNNRSSYSFSFFQTFFFSIAFGLLHVLMGSCVLLLCGFRWQQGDRLWFLSSSYLTGFFLVAAVTWLMLLCGGNLEQSHLLILWGILVLILSFFLKQSGRLRKNFETIQRTESLSDKKRDKMAFFPMIMFVAVIGSIFLITVATPVRDWDAMSHWIMKAKAMFYHHQLVFDYTHHNYYPILWPLHNAIAFIFSDGMHDQLAQWSSAFLFLSFMFQLRKGLGRLKISNSLVNWLMVFYAVCAFHDPRRPVWDVNFIAANAENIFLAFLTGAVVCCVMFLESQEKRYLKGFIIMSVALSLTKFEGFVMVWFMAGSLLFCAWSMLKKSRSLTPIMLLVFLSTLLPLSWSLWVKAQGYYSPVVHLQSALTFEKLSFLIAMNIHHLWQNSTALVVLGAALYLIVCPVERKYTETERFLLVLSVLLILFSGFSVLGYSLTQIEENFRTLFPRLFLRATPGILLLFCSLFLQRQASLDRK